MRAERSLPSATTGKPDDILTHPWPLVRTGAANHTGGMTDRIAVLVTQARRAAEQAEIESVLGARFPRAAQQSVEAVEQEIAAEIAYSLGRAGRKIQRSIAILNALLERQREETLSEAEQRRLHDEFDKERVLAERHLRDLLIQREALGFRHHDELKRQYQLPRFPR